MSSALTDEVTAYYSAKIREFGANPKGVDWSTEESQKIRFAQLLQIVSEKEKFSILDFGCGYAALFDLVSACSEDFEYVGFDLSEEMILAAQKSHPNVQNISLLSDERLLSPADFVVASGIFNVKLEFDLDVWEKYVFTTLDKLNALSTRGFSFNCLTSYSDEHKKRPDLYYGNPMKYFDHCKVQYSKNVALLHDYGLYEFTVLVRK